MALAIAALSSPGLARADTPRPKTWASCVEHVPKGATRPKIEEAFPDRGTSGWASTLTVTVTHGQGETVLPEGFRVQASSDAGRALEDAGFVIPEPTGGVAPKVTPDARSGKTTVAIPFVALPKEPGRHTMVLPPIPIAVARASGEQVTVCTRPHTIVVEDPIANEVDPKVKPNPPPRPQREEWVMAERVATGVLAGAILTLLALWLLRRWRRRPKVEPYVPPKLPWVAALEELAAIRASSLLADGKTDEYFDRVSDTVRKYLGGRYGFDGLESTTDEMRALLKRVRPPVPELPKITGFLSDCDLVKFARMVPTESDCVALLVRGEEIVRRTTPAPTHDDPPSDPRPRPRRARPETRASGGAP
jgi:hypothetical protein